MCSLGRDGDDLFDGRAGADCLAGEDGIDTASYSLAPAGVTVDLSGPIRLGQRRRRNRHADRHSTT